MNREFDDACTAFANGAILASCGFSAANVHNYRVAYIAAASGETLLVGDEDGMADAAFDDAKLDAVAAAKDAAADGGMPA